MRRRALFVAMVLLTVIIGTGCGLLGIGSGPNVKSQVESTIYRLAAAGEAMDLNTIEQHLADSIFAQMAATGEVSLQNSGPVERDDLIELIERVWSEKTMEQVTINISNIHTSGNTAQARGAFTMSFSDDSGSESYCAGTGTAHLVNDNGTWMITQVELDDVSCTLTIPGKDPGDEDDDADPTDPGDETPVPIPEGPQAFFDICHYLVQGSQGEQVSFLQEVLTLLGFYTGRIDGDFGPMTANAVKAFQQQHGLYVDGEVGPKTIAVLDKLLKEQNGYYSCGVTNTRPSAGETMVTETKLRPGTSYETRVLTYQSPNPGPTVVFVGCIHGNEKSGHHALTEAIDRGITISRGRVVIVPEFNKNGCRNNTRNYNGYDFNRQFPVGSTPKIAIAREMWDLIRSQPDLAFVVDFHDGFNNSLANTLLHTNQSKAGSVARKIRDELNKIRPNNSSRPRWRAFSEPVSGSLIRKVGRDLRTPGILAELAGRTNPDPLSLRKEYAWTIMKMVGQEFGIKIEF